MDRKYSSKLQQQEWKMMLGGMREREKCMKDVKLFPFSGLPTCTFFCRRIGFCLILLSLHFSSDTLSPNRPSSPSFAQIMFCPKVKNVKTARHRKHQASNERLQSMEMRSWWKCCRHHVNGFGGRWFLLNHVIHTFYWRQFLFDYVIHIIFLLMTLWVHPDNWLLTFVSKNFAASRKIWWTITTGIANISQTFLSLFFYTKIKQFLGETAVHNGRLLSNLIALQNFFLISPTKPCSRDGARRTRWEMRKGVKDQTQIIFILNKL